MKTIANYIAGEAAAPASGNYLEVLEPATGERLAKAPDSGPEDVDRAVARALFAKGSHRHAEALARVGLDRVRGLRDRVTRRLVMRALEGTATMRREAEPHG